MFLNIFKYCLVLVRKFDFEKSKLAILGHVTESNSTTISNRTPGLQDVLGIRIPWCLGWLLCDAFDLMSVMAKLSEMFLMSMMSFFVLGECNAMIYSVYLTCVMYFMLVRSVNSVISVKLFVRYHCGGRPEEVNSCVLNSDMVYL
jgi:hypothetical protein